MAFLAERGIKVGVKVAEVVDVGDAPVEDVKTRPWLPELKKLMAKGEFEDVTEDFNALYGRQFRPPKGWSVWDLARRAQWLDANAPLEAVAPRMRRRDQVRRLAGRVDLGTIHEAFIA